MALRGASLTVYSVLLLSACHSGGGETSDLAIEDMSGAVVGDAAMNVDASFACERTVPDADAVRTIVISHPFSDEAGDDSSDFEIFSLDSTGKITQPNVHFSLGPTDVGEIVFTPDGRSGYAVEEDGSVGVFGLPATGAPVVLQASFSAGFYATTLWVSASGDKLYGLDADTSANGGGVYQMTIDCDGKIGAATLLSQADLPYAAISLAGGKTGMYARSLPGAATGDSVHIVTLGPPFMRISSAVGFATDGDKAIVAGAAVTSDGRYLLFGDDDQFSASPNRISAIEITSTGLRPAQLLTPVQDPVSIVASPYGNAALVSSSMANALVVLAYDPTNSTTPFTNVGEPTYAGSSPDLPSTGILVSEGALTGHVFVAETQGIRQLRFETSGAVTDLGAFSTGTALAASVGAIGITP